MRTALASALMVSMSLLVCAEKITARQQPASTSSQFKITTVYADGDWIPIQYTCGVPDGASPGVQWSGAPQGTSSFALIFHDTDKTPANSPTDATHWVLWNIPASAVELNPGMPTGPSPNGILQGKNVAGANGCQPPCPPSAVTPLGVVPHHYVLDLHALDTKLSLAAGAGRPDLMKAIEGHVIGKASLVGLFGLGIDDKSWRWPVANLP